MLLTWKMGHPLYLLLESLIIYIVPFGLCYGAFFIYLKISQRQKINRAVRVETGERHLAKRNIPDMAGIVMIGIFLLCYIVFFDLSPRWIFLIIPILFGLLGLADDIVKSRTKNTKGIPARYRIILQCIIAVLFVYLVQLPPVRLMSLWPVPIPLVMIVIIILATVNAANFADGLDGLLSGMVLINVFGFLVFWEYYPEAAGLYYSSGDYDTDILGVFIPIIIAFLVFNRHPAKMFMGDGGSMFIGGFLAYYAYINYFTLPLLIMAFPMYFELISVVIQVISFRLTGKRVFPMTPFHHSFEKWGWSEPKIVWFYYIITLIFTALGVWCAVWQMETFSKKLLEVYS